MDYSSLWLNWQPINEPPAFMSGICAQVRSVTGRAALRELQEGVAAMTGHRPAELTAAAGACLHIVETDAEGESYAFVREGDALRLEGGARGLVFGAFDLLRGLALGRRGFEGASAPRYSVRMLDHWDNMDGSIERGYAGNSFFFEGNRILNGPRIRDYARLLASCGINGCCINNVNVKAEAVRLLTPDHWDALAELAATLAEYGVQLWLSVSFAAPMELGGLDTADPLDEAVCRWWEETTAALYKAVPNLGGFLVKADSEGRPGPFTYGRTQAEGANMLARALAKQGGKLLWRCFVYNCTQDWRDTKTDRARAQCDHFAPLDGQFDDNVLLQIKNGPVDFQVREPVSPLLGRLEHTNSIIEFQITQEYTGQQKHLCYLIPMFKEIMDFRLHHRVENDSVAETVSAVCAVSNMGRDYNWTGHDLAGANLYGFGRLSWDPALSAEEIAREYIRLTLGDNERVMATVLPMLMRSREVYEQYTAPLGIGWMVNPGHHYGPNPDGYEYDRWGTYHRATNTAIGVERGPEGTGYTGQYHQPLSDMYADVESCPEELLLFFHRVNYDYVMRDGRTLIQRIYDDHFEGFAAAEEFARSWDNLEGLLPEDLFRRVQARFAEQLRSAREWRDIINSWFCRRSGIPDAHGREIY